MGETDRIEWDDFKNEINLRLREIDFAGLDKVFDGRPAFIREDKRRDYGEPRFNMIVALDDLIRISPSRRATESSGSYPPASPTGKKGDCIMANDKKSEVAHDRTNWAALRAMSEDEIERIAVEDEENPATVSQDEWAHATWTGDTLGLTTVKTSIHASFDRDVVEFFKRDGRDYQARMNAVLRRHMDAHRDEKTGS